MQAPSWIPDRSDPWRNALEYFGLVCGLVAFAGTTGAAALSLAPTSDGRIKIVVIWAFGVSAAGAFAAWRLLRREHLDSRYGRVLDPLHDAHHKLRDVAFERYVQRAAPDVWRETAHRSLEDFAAAFSVAAGARAHATIKVIRPPRDAGNHVVHPYDYLVETFARSSARTPRPRHEGDAVTVGKNTDFRVLFDTTLGESNRFWMCNDLLRLEGYQNQHWPAKPTRRNVPYRATMVWPIRKVLRDETTTRQGEHYLWGFLTIDLGEPKLLNADRHFPIGAAYADHLMASLWDVEQARTLMKRLEVQAS